MSIPPDSTLRKIQRQLKGMERPRESNVCLIGVELCCHREVQDSTLVFLIVARSYLLVFFLGNLRGICSLGRGLPGPVSNHFSIVVLFGTTGILVELLFGFFLVLLTFHFLFGFFLFLGRGSLCFLRGRGLV